MRVADIYPSSDVVAQGGWWRWPLGDLVREASTVLDRLLPVAWRRRAGRVGEGRLTASLGVRFGREQVEMLECVYQHRLLSTTQLHVLYRDGLSLRRTQRALGAMERVGWLGSVRAPGGMKLWFVTEAGADAVEAIPSRAEPRRKVIPAEQAAGPLQQHTLAVNEVGVAFVRAAHERGEEFGPLSWRNEIAHPVRRPPGRRLPEMLIADAVLSYELSGPDGSVDLEYAFLELDRATMATERLRAKAASYRRLESYRGESSPMRPLWRRHYPHFPIVLVVLANGTRERLERRRWFLMELWEHSQGDRARDIDLHVCLYEDLIEQGPFACIFQSNHEPDRQVDWTGRLPDGSIAAAPTPRAGCYVPEAADP